MRLKTLSASDIWRPENSFDSLKQEVLKMDPVSFAESYLTLDGRPFKITGNGWKWMADIYRHIAYVSMSDNGKPVVMVKGRQVAATTAANNLELFFTASGVFGKNGIPPVRVMHAFPQLEIMHAFSKDKLEKMINGSAEVPDFEDKRNPGKLKPFIVAQKDSKREATDSLYYKQFKNGNTLWCESLGNEGTRVLGRTFDILFCDEVQDMTEVAIAKAIKCLTRAQHGPQPGGVQVYFGTPRQKGTLFHRMWEQSDQRRFYLGCVECKNYFLLYTPESDKWEKEIWLYGNVVKCPTCGCEQDKVEAIERGKWIPSPGRENADFVGFHYNQLFIPEFTKEIIAKQKPDSNPLNSEIIWNNEILGEFHSGQGMPITFEEIYKACRDADRPMAKSIEKDAKITYFGVDWGGKPDMDGIKRGQSFCAGCVLSVDHQERFSVEYVERLKRIDLESKKEFVERMFRVYSVRSAMGDIGFAEDLSGELKRIYGEKFKTVRNAPTVSGGVKYNKEELEIVVEKDRIINEVFNLLRHGQIRFPWVSYERLAWFVRHCCSMESRTTIRNGMPYQMYVKGKEQNDGFMALIYAYLAYKFDKTCGFRVNQNTPSGGRLPKPILAYVPKLRGE